MKLDKPVYKCCGCTDELYLNDDIYDIDGDIYCDHCGFKYIDYMYKRTVNERDIESQMPDYLEGD